MRIPPLALVLMLVISTAHAGPVVDFVVGGALIATGGGFYAASNNAKKDKEDAEKKLEASAVSAIQNDELWAYYTGAADWELIVNGNTSSYRTFRSNASMHLISALRHASDASKHGDSASQAQDDENLYKGVSYTSFGVGAFFLVKGIVGFAIGDDKRAAIGKKFEWARNINFSPKYDGGELSYTYRFNL